MWQSLIAKINTTLGEVPLVKDKFFIPKTKLTKYPCVFVQPEGFDNSFETGQENNQIYRFFMLVMVSAKGENNSAENAFGTILPKVVDAIIAQFDADWNGGTIEGHRVRVLINSAEAWEMSEEQDGAVCYAPLRLEIKLLANI